MPSYTGTQTLLLTDGGALGKSLAFSEPHFLNYNIGLITTYLTGSFLSKIKTDHVCQVFSMMLRRKRSSIKRRIDSYLMTLFFFF